MGFKVIRNERKIKEFSKKVIVAMTFLWFVTAIFGGVVVWFHNYGLDSLLTFVGTPMATGILGYMLKSAFENREKIKQNYEREDNYEN